MDDTVLAYVHILAQQLAPLYQTTQEQESIVWWLLQKITGKTHAQLLGQAHFMLTPAQEKTLHEWLHEHVYNHKPLQYILETVPFGELTLKVKPPILIPRPETEEWVLALAHELKKISKPLTILDMCTGSGCIGLTLAHTLPTSHVYAVDINRQACDLALENARLNNIRNISCIQSDLYQNIPNTLRFDVIVSNPPYISQTEWSTLEPMVKEWEDKNALVAHEEGYALITKIIQYAPQWLTNNQEFAQKNIPQLVIEIGYQQSKKTAEIMKRAGFKRVAIKKDLAGKDRIITGTVE